MVASKKNQQGDSQLIKSNEGFELVGAINFESVDMLWQQSLKRFAKVQHSFQINLAKVSALDSAGLALLVAWKKWAKAHNLAIDYVEPSGSLVALAEVNRVSAILEL